MATRPAETTPIAAQVYSLRSTAKGLRAAGYNLSARDCDRAAETIHALVAALRGLKPILDSAESNASGNPEWESVSRCVNVARAALAKSES